MSADFSFTHRLDRLSDPLDVNKLHCRNIIHYISLKHREGEERGGEGVTGKG